jgi:hypothetical protein
VIYLLGCHHTLHQLVPRSRLNSLQNGHLYFCTFISHLLKNLPIDVIAEEAIDPDNRVDQDPEYFSVVKIHTIPKSNFSGPHLYCDPNSDKRHDLGIGRGLPFVDRYFYRTLETLIKSEREAYFHYVHHRNYVREGYWMNQLNNFKKQNVLFICGMLHIRTFHKRLAENDFNTEIICEFIGDKNLKDELIKKKIFRK